MSTEMQKQTSATEEDQSVIIHEKSPTMEFPFKPSTAMISTQSVPAVNTNTATYQTKMSGRAKSDSKSGNYQFQIQPPANKLHGREASVGNLIPQRYLTQASSLNNYIFIHPYTLYIEWLLLLRNIYNTLKINCSFGSITSISCINSRIEEYTIYR